MRLPAIVFIGFSSAIVANANPAAIDLEEILIATLASGASEIPQPLTLIAPVDSGKAPCTPEGSTLAGAYSLGQSTTWIYRLDGGVAPALDYCTTALLETGYLRIQPDYGLSDRQSTISLCKERKFVSLTAKSHASRHFLIETYPSTEGDCVRDGLATFADSTIPVPVLTPPAGVSSRSHGSGWSGDNYHATQELFSSEVSDELLDHYSSQFVSTEWAIESRHITARTGIASFTRVVDGKSWIALILVVDQGSAVELNLQITSFVRR